MTTTWSVLLPILDSAFAYAHRHYKFDTGAALSYESKTTGRLRITVSDGIAVHAPLLLDMTFQSAADAAAFFAEKAIQLPLFDLAVLAPIQEA